MVSILGFFKNKIICLMTIAIPSNIFICFLMFVHVLEQRKVEDVEENLKPFSICWRELLQGWGTAPSWSIYRFLVGVTLQILRSQSEIKQIILHILNLAVVWSSRWKKMKEKKKEKEKEKEKDWVLFRF